MFTNSNSNKDQAECVLSLINKCSNIISKNGYGDTDTRTSSLVNIRFVGYSAMANANLLYNWSLQNDTKEIIPALLGLVDVNEKSVQLMGDSIHKTSKLSLILIGQFQIENCIQNLSSALGLNSNSPGFYNKANTLINHLGINADRLEILNTGALIRNSLHSNGIHNGFRNTDFHVTIGGVDYDFLHDQKVSCASLPHISHSLEHSIIVLDEIINTQEVKQITNLIEDKYVSQLNL